MGPFFTLFPSTSFFSIALQPLHLLLSSDVTFIVCGFVLIPPRDHYLCVFSPLYVTSITSPPHLSASNLFLHLSCTILANGTPTSLVVPPTATPQSTATNNGIMDIAELQRVVAELTKKNDDLKAHVATAEAATRAATGRAQIRYTEKLLANRDAERCKTAFELEKKERLDDQLKAMRCFYGLQQTIEALRQEKEFLVTNSAPQLSQDGSTHKLTDVQNIRDENMRLKMLAASITEENKQLAATITQLQNDLAATQVNSAVAGPDTVARAEIQQIQATLEQDRLAFTTHKQQMRTAWVNETASLNKQLANCRQEEEQKRVSLQNQLRTQAEEVQWYKLQLQQALERAQQGSAHSHLGVHGGIPLTPEQKNEQVESIQKRRRLNLARYVDS